MREKGLSTRSTEGFLEKQISKKTLSPILKSYLEEILSKFSFTTKQIHSEFPKIFISCVMTRYGLFLTILEKDTPIFFDDYQKLMNQYEVPLKGSQRNTLQKNYRIVKHFLICSILLILKKSIKTKSSDLFL